jgi:hypothetical protein
MANFADDQPIHKPTENLPSNVGRPGIMGMSMIPGEVSTSIMPSTRTDHETDPPLPLTSVPNLLPATNYV